MGGQMYEWVKEIWAPGVYTTVPRPVVQRTTFINDQKHWTKKHLWDNG